MRWTGRRALLGGAAVVVLAAAALVAASTLVRGRGVEPVSAVPRLPPATAPITLATLAQTRTVSGTLGYGESEPIGAAAGIVTRLAPLGSIVGRGEAIFEVDGQPVVVLYGTVPMYRTLRAGAEEADGAGSTALEEAEADVADALMALSLEHGRIEDAEARLEQAARRKADGARDDPRTPEFIALRTAARAAERRAATVRELHRIGDASPIDVQVAEEELAVARANLEAALEQIPQQLRAAEIDLSAARLAARRAERQLADARERLEALLARDAVVDRADVRQLQENLLALGYDGFAVDGVYTRATAEAVRAWQADLGVAATGVVEPWQVAFVPGPVRVAEHVARKGDATAGGPVLRVTGTMRLVTLDLRVADLSLAVVGRAVSVTIPGLGVVGGVIADVGTVVANDAVSVTVTLDDEGAVGALDAAPVDVDLVSDVREGVLSVPVAALLALSGGGFGVEIVDGDATRIVPVRTGMFAAGRVEVSGEEIAEGMRVGVPR